MYYACKIIKESVIISLYTFTHFLDSDYEIVYIW